MCGFYILTEAWTASNENIAYDAHWYFPHHRVIHDDNIRSYRHAASTCTTISQYSSVQIINKENTYWIQVVLLRWGRNWHAAGAMHRYEMNTM